MLVFLVLFLETRGDCLVSKLLQLFRGKIRNRGYFEEMVMEALLLELIYMRVNVSDREP